jgi:scyllo-inositol 2-dehydrogenase (NADP+)
MPDVIQAAIIGYGKSGQNIHAPLIDAADRIVLRAVVKRSGSNRLQDRKEVEVYRGLVDVLNNDSINLVIVTTPNHLHFSMASKALEAGKHVVIDKPFTVTSEESEELIQLAKKQKRVLTVFHNRRWDGDFLTVSKLVNEQAAGRLTEFESFFNRFRNELKDDAWKEKDLPGSGILYDLGPHLIDQSLKLFGTPNSIYADIRTQRGGAVDDWFEIDFYYDGFSAKLKAGMLILDETPRFVLRGDRGAYVKFWLDPQEQALKDDVDPKSAFWGKEDEKKYGTLKKWRSGKVSEVKINTAPGNYPHFYRNVADAILKGTDLSVKPEEAKEVIRLIELSIKSSEKGCKIQVV